MAEWSRRDITDSEMFAAVQRFGAGSTKELKWYLKTDSQSIRRVLGKLMFHNKVFPMAYQSAVCWMVVTGERGRPNVRKLRIDAGLSASIRQSNAEKTARLS